MTAAIHQYNDSICIKGLDPDTAYIITKWYGSSLAIFREPDFRRYLSKLDTDFRENGHGRSVIRYFLSAAVSMLTGEDGNYSLPPALLSAADCDGELPVAAPCPHAEDYPDCFPILLIASAANIDGALALTDRKH